MLIGRHCWADLATSRTAVAPGLDPEQIPGDKLESSPTVSHECIYLHVYADKRRAARSIAIYAPEEAAQAL